MTAKEYNSELEHIDRELGDLWIRTCDLIEQCPDENKKAQLKGLWEAYDHFGFKQLLGQGNPYDNSLETLKIENQEL